LPFAIKLCSIFFNCINYVTNIGKPSHNVCAGYATTLDLKNLRQILRPKNFEPILSMFTKYQMCISRLVVDYDVCVYEVLRSNLNIVISFLIFKQGIQILGADPGHRLLLSLLHKCFVCVIFLLQQYLV
jgi:hypothetical protein